MKATVEGMLSSFIAEPANAASPMRRPGVAGRVISDIAVPANAPVGMVFAS